MRPYTKHSARSQYGTSLIEILVSILILTMGVLAMAGLHTASIRYSKTAEFRTTAVHLAEDLAEKIRANARGSMNGNYTRILAWQANLPVQDVPVIDCVALACTADQFAQQVAANDLAQWLNQARIALHGAGLFIQPIVAGSARLDLWVSWLEPDTNPNNAAADAQINAAYTCPQAMNGPANLRCLRLRVTP